MKPKKLIHLYIELILIFSLVRINGNNSPVGTKNFEFKKDGKRELEQSDSYIIIAFSEIIEANNNILNSDYMKYIDHIKNGDSTLAPSDSFSLRQILN